MAGMTAATAALSPDEALGRLIHQVMWDKKISQERLAARLGIHQTTLSKKLRGERPWSFAEMIEVSDALDINALDLLKDLWGPGVIPQRKVVGGLAEGQPTQPYVLPFLTGIDGECQISPPTGDLHSVVAA